MDWWPMSPMRARSEALSRVTRWPKRWSSPLDADVRVAMTLSSVLLPAPFGAQDREKLTRWHHEADVVEDRAAIDDLTQCNGSHGAGGASSSRSEVVVIASALTDRLRLGSWDS